MATLEEASHCPKCEQVGRQSATRPSATPGIRIIPFTCENEQCVWYNTGWLVQLNADGSIPDPATEPRGRKQFDRPGKLEVVQNMDQVNAMADAFNKYSTQQPGGRQ